jgi:hypothetical protein
MNDLEQAAADYLFLGLSVIALVGKAPNGKVHPHGLYDAFRLAPDGSVGPELDEAVERAFNHPDTTGIGILTNWPYFVVDIDGEEGAAQWRDLVGPDVYIPDRWVAKTGRGLHLWFSDYEPRKTRKLGPKLDLKAAGGYVAAPPSLHPDGHRYTWLLEPAKTLPPTYAPDALVGLLDDADRYDERKALGRATTARRVRVPQFTDGKLWPGWGFNGLIEAVAKAGEGNRNRLLYWAACTLFEEGGDEDDWTRLAEATLVAGLTGREARLTVRSARKAMGVRG